MSNNNYYEQERTPFRPPRITWAVQRILLLTLGVFALQLLIGPLQYLLFHRYEFSHEFPGGMLNIWFGYQPHLWYLMWKPFTYMFLHSGITHLGFNLLWLYFFGPDVERRLGTMEFFRFYIACGAIGVLATLPQYLVAGSQVSVVGASGAVMGVLVAFAMIDPNRQFFIMPFPWPITARGLVVLVVVMNLISGLGNSQTSVVTHFGGMAVGFLYMYFLPQIRKFLSQGSGGGGTKKNTPPPNKVGEAVDNIFKFKDFDRR
jgi:membrane associated rhomboid family serine protease